ncbi:MAG: hypothetical protein KDK56_03020 [Simkania sp.]|nr:hypothetical protein [Simkania sp.]MCP5489832.1 hypothetical protein [Chlamydiales bacterium]
MEVRIGIFGSSEIESSEVLTQAVHLGQALNEHDVLLMTGACSGLPYAVAAAASEKQKWGFSPVRNYEEQLQLTPDDDISIYDKMIFVPETFPFAKILSVSKKYRNVLSTASCDGGIVIGGKWGTLNEVTNLIDMGKPIGVLVGSGGIADEVSALVERLDPDSLELLILERDPKKLVTKLLGEINS